MSQAGLSSFRSTGRRLPASIALALVGLVGVVVTAPADAVAASGPKISGGALTPLVGPGEKLEVQLTAKNRGKAKTAKAAVRFLLSADKRESKDDLALKGKGKLPALAARKSKTVKASAEVPSGAEADAYYLLACAGKAKCRALGGTVAVTPPVEPQSVAPQLEEGNSASAVIGRDGGRVDAVGSDNVLYSLYVPSGSLVRPERIKITPLSGVGGLPFAAGLTAGVHLEPDGVEFTRPATLIIQGDRIAPAPDQTAFGYHGTGQDFHLEPLYRQPPPELEGQYDPSKTILIPVSHFSGTGVAPATDLETARQLRYGAAEARDRLSQEAAEALKKGEDLDRIFSDYIDQVLIPEAAAAAFSDALYESAIRSFLSWERQRQLLGGSEDVHSTSFGPKIAQVEKLLAQAFEALKKRLKNRCEAGDFDVQTRILQIERQLQLLGVDDHSEEFEQMLDKCLRFELRVTSHLEHHASAGSSGFSGTEDYSIELQGSTPLTLQGGQLTGTAPFNYTLVQISGNGEIDFGFAASSCTFHSTGNTQPGQLTVQEGDLGYTRGKSGGLTLDPSLLIDPGTPMEEVHSDCQGHAFGQPTSSSEDNYEDNWLRYFRAAHSDDSRDENGNGPWLIDDFGPGRHPIIGEQVFHESSEQAAYSLNETWQLVHTPAK